MINDFLVECDASDITVGAVLSKDHSQGLQDIYYFSGMLDPIQDNYLVHDC